MFSILMLLKRKPRGHMEPHNYMLPTPAHLCTKLQVPSMGSMIQVGLWVSTHLAPEAVASSAMNLLGQGAQPESSPTLSRRVYVAGIRVRVSVPVPKHPPNQTDSHCCSFGGTQGKWSRPGRDVGVQSTWKSTEASKTWFPIPHGGRDG